MIRLLRILLLSLALSVVTTTDLSAQYDKDIFHMRGRMALSDGRYAQAIENYNILAQLDTADYWTFFFRGIAKYNLGDLRGAKKDFDRTIRINPVFTSGYHYRGITESRFGNYETALEDLKKAISLRPGNEGLYFSRGVTLFLAQQFSPAIEDFDWYIRKSPKDPSAYLNRGACHLYLGDTLKAISDYDRAIRLDRFDPEGYVRRGCLYASQDEYDKALEDLDMAIRLDSTNTFAYFNRALLHHEQKRYKEAMYDLDCVLREEPGNSLTLYNRGLINLSLGEYHAALKDFDHVIRINPNNVLAYFNRAAVMVELGLYKDALKDYDKAIELYPDFVKAYVNRSYVNNKLGNLKASRNDKITAEKKVKDFQEKSQENPQAYSDTSSTFSNLLSLDADFAKKDFNNELLQNRDVDIRLRPLYKFVITGSKDDTNYALSNKYENPLIASLKATSPFGIEIMNTEPEGVHSVPIQDADIQSDGPMGYFLRAMCSVRDRQFNSAMAEYTVAIAESENLQGLEAMYAALYYMNRAVLRAEMIDFLVSIDNNVQKLTMEDSGSIRARVSDRERVTYDYTDAIEDMKYAQDRLPDIPYIHYNMGNLLCLSSEYVLSIDEYSKAISLYPYMGDAFFNRGLVLIYLKDKEKGCMDLSRAGELGVYDAYAVIKKYCEDKNNEL